VAAIAGNDRWNRLGHEPQRGEGLGGERGQPCDAFRIPGPAVDPDHRAQQFERLGQAACDLVAEDFYWGHGVVFLRCAVRQFRLPNSN
jgi:hypothetical protein